MQRAKIPILEKMKTIMRWIMVYIAIAGTISFSLFILEEALQTLVFSSWQSISCNKWDTVKEAITLMEETESTMSKINNYAGWINPLSWLSYNAFGKSSRHYNKALKERAIANEPELFTGETITINDSFESYTKENDIFVIKCKNSRIKIHLTNFTESKYVSVTGILQKNKDELFVSSN
ncbi:MAG: hypothetical protein C0403_19660 [Desulfobacterium sp.]|nr:hypothetical protein [Desulfobacterium sp.]